MDSLLSPGAFMSTIKSADAMRRVAFTADMLAPLACRGLRARLATHDCPPHISKADAWKRCVAIDCTRRKMLCLLACRNFSPKLSTETSPEVYAVIQVMEKMAHKLRDSVTVHGTQRHRGSQLSNVEMHGVRTPAYAVGGICHACIFHNLLVPCQTFDMPNSF